MGHKVYEAIVKAIRARKLVEPFSKKDFEAGCPGFRIGTYNAFLYKHRRGNPSRKSELFELVSPGQFRCLRPFKYGL